MVENIGSKLKNSNITVDKHKLEIFSLEEVAKHDTENDCWLVIYDYVYNCTEFLKKHPGGSDLLLEYAGRDATLAFVGTGHSENAKTILDCCIIGQLPLEEQIFRRFGGIKIVEDYI